MNKSNNAPPKNLSKMNVKKQKNNHIHHTNKFFFSLFFLLSFTLSNAQTFSNLGFEYWQGNKFPLFWQHPGMTVSPDSVTKQSGQYALKAVRQQKEIEAINIPYGLLFQPVVTAFKYENIQGKKLEVSVRIKNNLTDTSAHSYVFIQLIDTQNPGNNQVSTGNKVAQQDDWTKSTASITVKEITPSTTILMGVLMIGQGEMWLDDYEITCDGRLPEETYPRTTDLTTKEKKWLSAKFIPISNETLTNKKQFAKSIADARLVGIGDNVHGSASVIKLKNIISKHLIENEDFTLLAIEDSPCTGESINQYISGLTDSYETNINVMYTNPDFKDFISWLRAYNQSATKKVRVFGVDVNIRYENQIKHLDRYTSNKYSVQLDSILSIITSVFNRYDPKADRSNRNTTLPFTEDQRKYYQTHLERIKEVIQSQSNNDNQKTLSIYYVNNLLNYLTFDFQVREKQMAGNIDWLLSQYPNEKMIYLAHNSHVGNLNSDTKKTGAWLKEWLKNNYYIIGSCYFDGTDSYKKAALHNSAQVINKAAKGSYEYLFNQIETDCFYLDLNKAAKNPSNQWLFQPMLMRSYGVEPFNYYFEFSIINLSRQFDGVVFIKRSVPL